MDKIPVSVLVTTLNEAENLPRCLSSLQDFDEVVVIDSNSTDGTPEIAKNHGAKLVPFTWNGIYPKKRQWCLDTLPLKYDRIFFVDADEELTPGLCQDIRRLDWSCAGYFVKGRYVIEGHPLRFGFQNNKLALFDRRRIAFPVVNDLDLPGMGEMEGHYQPVLKPGFEQDRLGQIQTPLLHYAYADKDRWTDRHENYAAWEAGMIRRKAYPEDPSPRREIIKRIFRQAPLRPHIAFLDSFVLKFGFLDGKYGFDLAWSRFAYYRAVRQRYCPACNTPGITS